MGLASIIEEPTKNALGAIPKNSIKSSTISKIEARGGLDKDPIITYIESMKGGKINDNNLVYTIIKEKS
jgi:hypothetical protein